MDVLFLGGTGAIGVPLIKLLSEEENINIYVTSRSEKNSEGNVKYIKGNARDNKFLQTLLTKNYDAIIDFMVYSTKELEDRLPMLLDHTNQYFFFSSARCYAESKTAITENSSRLVDVCTDSEYLAIDEYGMAKGREENVLRASSRNNWTIIRPYITYNDYRIQLGVYEKEDWLKRALIGKTIVFPKDIASKKTSLTYGPDVAGALVELLGNEKAYGQAFHITTAETHTWGEVLEFYCDVIERKTGKRPKVKLVENSEGLQRVWNKWQIKYDRLYDRWFDNSKIESVRGKYAYKPTFEGLEECLDGFLSNPKWLGNNWRYEAWCDKQAGEWTSIFAIPGKKDKLRYLKHRLLG